MATRFLPRLTAVRATVALTMLYGYLPTPEQHKLGGYETWLGTNTAQEDASVILTDQLLEMLAQLAKAK